MQTQTNTKTRAPRASRKATVPASVETQTPVVTEPTPEVLAAAEAARAQAKADAEHAAWVAAMAVDHAAEVEAGSFFGTFEAYLDLQRVTDRKERYTGRMLALVAARKHYVKGSNGNQHSGDWIGTAFQDLPRTEVVRCCLAILALEANPYTHLNPGQQSMNLRNKVRGACQRGEISVEHVKTTIAKFVA